MSLVLDNLKKLKKQSGSGSVPPGMINLAPKRKKKMPKTSLLLLLAIALGGYALTFLLDSRPAYTVAPALNGQKVQPAKPYQKTPDITDEEIQARINAAVKVAVAERDAMMGDKISSSIESNSRRANMTDSLPEPANQKRTVKPVQAEQPAMPETKAQPEKNSSIIAQVKEIQAMQNLDMQKTAMPKSSVNEIEKGADSGRPVISDKQRKEFNRKIEYNTLLAVGGNALANGDYARAAESYKDALAMKVSDLSIINLVRADIGMGRYAEVASSLRKYDRYLDDMIVTAAASELNTAGRTKDALSILSSYEGRFANNGRIFYTEGEIHESAADYTSAEASYKKALVEMPTDEYYSYAYARVLDINGKLEEAVSQYRYTVEKADDKNISKNSFERLVILEEYLKLQKEAKSGEESAEQ